MTAMQTSVGAYQQQHVTPRLQQSVKLLLMSSAEFQQHLRQQLDANPFLEAEDDLTESLDGIDDREPPDEVEEHEDIADLRTATGQASASHSLDWLVDRPGLRDHLLGQLTGLRVGDRQRRVIEAVVHGLDEDGYLRDSRDDVAAALGEAIDDCDWECAVRLVQALAPAGVGARDLRECLLLQLAHDSDCSDVLLARTLVAEHFEALAAHDWQKLVLATKVDRAAVRRAIEAIRKLNPRPGRDHSSETIRYAVPDVFAVKRRGRWTATLNPATVPKVRLADMYVDIVKENRAECRELSDQLREARWTLKNIAQRLQTIEQIAAAIIARQTAFFEFGPIALKPMHLADVARDVGVHESTVSRVTTSKYMATPFGTLELKYFFSRSLPACDKGPAATAIRRLIEETLRDEDPRTPLSDAEIARRLQRQGLSIARRTVTKYRQQMGIAAVETRRIEHEFAAA